MNILKSSALIVLAFISLAACNSEKSNSTSSDNGENTGKAEITFKNLEYNFGKITEGEKVACVFKFRNTGDGDLIINSATTSCGCTVPRFDKKPIKPGSEGSLEVVFDSAHREGVQTKTITVRSNARVKVVVLRIIADIMKE